MKVIVAGSRRLPKGQAPRLLLRILAALPDDAVVMLRSGRKETGRFEQDMENLCDLLGIIWMWCRPEPTEKHPGRASVYIRDMEMVEGCDLAILFFTPEDVEEGYSGTYHLLDKCLDVGRPVHAYSVDDHGRVERVGDYDPEHFYDHLALDVARNAT